MMFDLTPFGYNPRNLTNYFDEMEKRLFGSMFDPGSASAFRTDIVDAGDKYVLKAELPGFDKEDLHIDVDGDCLTVGATHKEETEDTKDHFVRRERRWGSFQRTFDISGIRAENIAARYENGVLELDLPKKENEQLPEARKIEIH